MSHELFTVDNNDYQRVYMELLAHIIWPTNKAMTPFPVLFSAMCDDQLILFVAKSVGK